MEDVLFDCFFEEGHIATNYPTVVSAGDAEDKSYYYSSLDDAKKSFCNYFVVLVIYYDVFKSKNPEAELLSNISSLEWKLFNTGTSSEIADGKRTSVAFAGERNRGIDISSFTSSIAKDIIAALRAR